MLCRVHDSISVFSNRHNYYLLDAKISLLWKILWLLFLGCMSLIDSVVRTSWFLNTFAHLLDPDKDIPIKYLLLHDLAFSILLIQITNWCTISVNLLVFYLRKKEKKKIRTCWSLLNPSALISTGFFFFLK